MIEPTLEELDQKMREAETESHEVICQIAKISEFMLLFDDFFLSRAKESASRCGQFSKFTIRGPAISGIYSTDEKPLVEVNT